MPFLMNCRGNFDHKAYTAAKKLRKQGLSYHAIGGELNVSHTTVRKALLKGVSPAKRVPRKPPPLPRQRIAQINKRRKLVRSIASIRVRRFGVRVQLYNSPARIAAAVLDEGFEGPISKYTVRRDLHFLGLTAKKRPKGPERKEHDAAARLEFAKQHVHLAGEDVMFSDEKWYDSNDHIGFYEWCEDNEWPSPQMRGQSGQNGIPKLHVWGVIGTGFKKLFFIPVGQMVDAVYYQGILQKHLRHLQRQGRYFVQDGAPSHRAKTTLAWLQRNKVKTLWPWPARSPDLNPIEVMWRIVEERCGRAAAQTHEELQAAVQKAWDEVPQSTVDALCASFTDCLKECIKVNGELVLRNRMRASVRGQR